MDQVNRKIQIQNRPAIYLRIFKNSNKVYRFETTGLILFSKTPPFQVTNLAQQPLM